MVFILNSLTHKISPYGKDLFVKLKDPRKLTARINDLFIARRVEAESRERRLTNPWKMRSHNFFARLQEDNKSYEPAEKNWQQKPSSKLVVLIHGLNSSPLAWSAYLDEIEQIESTISYFIPYVYKKGYCKVSEAADPILNAVQTYATLYPNNPIYLVGHSNGARIAAYAEQRLNAKDIRLVSIAGSHCGSMLMKWIGKLGLEKRFNIPLEMVEELSYLGAKPTKSLVEWQLKQKNYKDIEKKVERIFYASADDFTIFPYQTSYPNLPNSSYYLVARESHVTIIDGVKSNVLSYIYNDE